MLGIRQKLALGFGGILVTVGVIGTLTITQITQLGEAIDVILRENYRSVIACQEMKESLERIDSGVLFFFAGNGPEGQRHIDENTTRFVSALKTEIGNVTLPGEQAKAAELSRLFGDFSERLTLVTAPDRTDSQRKEAYFNTVHPVFQKMKVLAQEILELNQANMVAANNHARQLAESAQTRIVLAIVLCAAIAILFLFFIQRWILGPISALIESTNEIRRGNLDLVLDTKSRDEIGHLSESFNSMTSALRAVRKHDRMNFLRTKRATEEVFKALPAAIAVLDLDGNIEVATETAERHFGMKPGLTVRELGMDWLTHLTAQALREGRSVEGKGSERWIQQFIDGREYFFHPMAVPIPVGPKVPEVTGVAIMLNDVTQVHEQRELKRGVVATVSHQLKTPLQSLRMSIHLLLEERVGTLNEQQMELASAAREESERLKEMLDDLLDLDRIESDRSRIQTGSVAPITLAREGITPFLTEAKGKGVTLVNAVHEDLPDVLAEPSRIRHVFGNLIANALRFTQPGGTITVSACTEGSSVQFSVEDTGTGVAPEHVNRLFERFFRVPGQDEKSGVGLGLSIVKEIIEAHGGTVSAQSEIGTGTRVSFTLPLSAS